MSRHHLTVFPYLRREQCRTHCCMLRVSLRTNAIQKKKNYSIIVCLGADYRNTSLVTNTFEKYAIQSLSVVSPRPTGNIQKGLCFLSVGSVHTPPTMSSAQSPPSPPSPPTHEVNVPTFAFRIDVLLLSLFALYVASTLPRALVRLFQPSEIFRGFFLRAQRTPVGRSNSTRTLLRRDTLGSSGPVTKSESKGNDNAPPVHHSTDARAALGEESKATDVFPAVVIPVANRTRHARQPYAPTRMPRWTTIVHPSFAYALNFRISSGFSLGQLFVLLVYGLIVLYACLYRSNPLKDPIRTAYIAVSQIPIVVALANKSNWLSGVSGVGYEKVNIIESRASPKPLYSESKTSSITSTAFLGGLSSSQPTPMPWVVVRRLCSLIMSLCSSLVDSL